MPDDRRPYVIGTLSPPSTDSTTVDLATLADRIGADPAVRLVRRKPEYLVIEMTPARAEELQRQFPGLVVEEDRTVQPFSTVP